MIIDVLLLIVLIVSAGIAFFRGFIREVLTIIGVVGGAVAALFGGPQFKLVVRDWLGVTPGADESKLFDIVPMSLVADALAYGSIFIAVVIILSLLSNWLAKTARSLGLGLIDRTLGVAFGLARGMLLIALLYMPVFLFVSDEEKKEWTWLSQSHAYPYLEAAGGWVAGYMPEQDKKDDRHPDAETGPRRLLENLDLLRKDAPADAPAEPIRPDAIQAPAATVPENTGYDETPREQLQQLIEGAPAAAEPPSAVPAGRTETTPPDTTAPVESPQAAPQH